MSVFPQQGELLTWELLTYMQSVLFSGEWTSCPVFSPSSCPAWLSQYRVCLSLVMAGQKRHENRMDLNLDLANPSLSLACHRHRQQMMPRGVSGGKGDTRLCPAWSELSAKLSLGSASPFCLPPLMQRASQCTALGLQ